MFMMILTIFFSDFLRTSGLASTDIKYFKNWFFNLKNQLVGKNGVLDYYIWHNKDVAQLIYTGFVNRCVHMERDSVSVFRHIAAFFKKYKRVETWDSLSKNLYKRGMSKKSGTSGCSFP